MNNGKTNINDGIHAPACQNIGFVQNNINNNSDVNKKVTIKFFFNLIVILFKKIKLIK